MPLKIIDQEITGIRCDAIVNTIDTEMNPVYACGKRSEAYQSAMAKSCSKLRKSSARPFETVISPAIDLKCNYVIHVILPNGGEMSREEVGACYKNILTSAAENECTSLAIPFISQSASEKNKAEHWRTAKSVIVDFLAKNDLNVFLIASSDELPNVNEAIMSGVTQYIRDAETHESTSTTETHAAFAEASAFSHRREGEEADVTPSCAADYSVSASEIKFDEVMFWGNGRNADGNLDGTASKHEATIANYSANVGALRLEGMLRNLDKGFRDTLFYYIDKKGLSDVECYKRSNVDKKTFSKIKCNADYRPSKVTAVSFAVGLHLDMSETEHLLSTAGMCLSHSSKFDVIIEYFIESGGYETIFDVNEVLYKFDQSLLGV